MALLAFIASGAASAQSVYRTVGADGRVTFSDRSPSPAQTSAPAPASGTTSTAANTAPGTATADMPYALRQVANRYPVTLYTTADCAPCDAARSALRQRGVPHTERTVQTTTDRQALQRASGQEQLPFATVGKQHLLGWDASEWQQYLDLAGYPSRSTLPAHWQPAAATPLTPPVTAAAASTMPTPAAASAPPPAAVPAPTAAPARNAQNPTGITF